MSSLSPAGRSSAAHQNVRPSLCRFTLSDGRKCRFPCHNSFRINTYKSVHKAMIIKHLRKR
jgi:hypothetical protein